MSEIRNRISDIRYGISDIRNQSSVVGLKKFEEKKYRYIVQKNINKKWYVRTYIERKWQKRNFYEKGKQDG